MTKEIKYQNPFTLDGRLKPSGPVTEAKVAKVKELFESGYSGDRVAAAHFEESITTSDAIFNAAYLINLQTIPQFDLLPRAWEGVASVRELPDFRPAILTGIFGGFDGLQRQGSITGGSANNPQGQQGIPPVVPEGAEYPYATIASQEASYGRLRKRGFKVGWTWEARVNDAIDFFGQIPGEMLSTALDAEDYEVFSALTNGVDSSVQLLGGTAYTGETVTANSVITRPAVARAIYELSQRKINGRYIQVNGGYNLVVPYGTGDAVRWMLNQQIYEVQDGSLKLTSSYLSSGLASTTVVESIWVTGTNWYLVPKPGTTRRPVLELGRLRGNTAPELRIDNVTGNYNGGASVSPFEGSFTNDTIDMRLRYALTGILWDKKLVVVSLGSGTA